MTLLVASLLVGIGVLYLLVNRDGWTRAGVLLWVLFAMVLLSSVGLGSIVAFASTVQGTAQYDSTGYWFTLRLLTFLTGLVCIPASAVTAFVLVLHALGHRTWRSLRWLIASVVIVGESLLCFYLWVASGAFPSA
jgi:hypothetical protein